MTQTPTFIRARYEAAEAGFVPALVTVSRSETNEPGSVVYRVGGTALAGRDYARLPGHLEFARHQSEATIRVQPLTNYRNTRRDETVVLTLEPSSNPAVGAIPEATVTIRHDPARKGLPPDEHFFAALDLTRPALAGVREAVAAGDYPAARARLAAHFREPRPSVFPFDPVQPNLALCDAALNRTYTVFGITHTFGDPVDWSANDLADPNYCWGFNRMEWWPHYAAAYTADPAGNARYAEALFAELADWLANSPVSLTYFPLQPGDRWRHLEVAIRSGFNWPIVFALVKNSPLLSDDLLVDWIKSFYVHARHLEVNAELFTNRGSGEAIALYVVGVLFPEFADAPDWVRLGLERMEGMLRHDVMPDGVENEFSPNYHSHVAEGIVKMHRVAVANGRQLTPFLAAKCAQLFDYLALACEPSFTLPHLNDSCHTDVPRCLALAAEIFPDRADYPWFATRGREGSPPARVSHLFPDAGHAVMRSHWGPDACYLLMDAGPFGTSHGHEDCLSLNVSGYGVRHLIDCGPYNYEDTHPFRLYSTRSHGKTMPLVDDLDQNRRSALVGRNNTDIRVGEPVIPPPHVFDHATPVFWRTSPRYDYAAGTYGLHPDEVWGADKLRPAIVTRHVLFLKPDVWVVVDNFRPLDGQPHAYSGLFQCSAGEAPVDAVSQRVTIQVQPGQFDPCNRVVVTTPQPSLTITPLLVPGLSLSVSKGQETPSIAGFQFEKNTPWLKQPIPTARYDLPPTMGDVCLAYVLAAAPADDAVRTPIVSPVVTAPGTFGVRVTSDEPSQDHTIIISLDGQPLEWAGRSHPAPALVLNSNVPHEWLAV